MTLLDLIKDGIISYAEASCFIKQCFDAFKDGYHKWFIGDFESDDFEAQRIFHELTKHDEFKDTNEYSMVYHLTVDNIDCFKTDDILVFSMYMFSNNIKPYYEFVVDPEKIKDAIF